MGKKRTGEKLDQVLAEIRKLKGEVKILTKQQADLAVQVDKLSAKKGPAAARKPVKKRAKPARGTQRKSSSAPKRPMLVAPPDAATG